MIVTLTDFGLQKFLCVCKYFLNFLFIYGSHWQSRENPSDDQDPDHWDHALLLTGLDLFAVGRDGFTTHQIVGK